MTDQLPAASFFHELESTRRKRAVRFQLAECGRHFRFFHPTEFIWNEFIIVARTSEDIAQFGRGQRFLCAEQ